LRTFFESLGSGGRDLKLRPVDLKLLLLSDGGRVVERQLEVEEVLPVVTVGVEVDGRDLLELREDGPLDPVDRAGKSYVFLTIVDEDPSSEEEVVTRVVDLKVVEPERV
jgi:hypothetical protein